MRRVDIQGIKSMQTGPTAFIKLMTLRRRARDPNSTEMFDAQVSFWSKTTGSSRLEVIRTDRSECNNSTTNSVPARDRRETSRGGDGAMCGVLSPLTSCRTTRHVCV